jgi:hypothetical protein
VKHLVVTWVGFVCREGGGWGGDGGVKRCHDTSRKKMARRKATCL